MKDPARIKTKQDKINHPEQCCGAGLFCLSRNRWKSSGSRRSRLSVCDLGVLWWQRCDNSYNYFNNFYTNWKEKKVPVHLNNDPEEQQYKEKKTGQYISVLMLGTGTIYCLR